MTNPIVELLPCPVPWCGGEADTEWYAVGKQSCPYWVRCQKCGCTTPTQYSTVAEAMEAWNTRIASQSCRVTEEMVAKAIAEVDYYNFAALGPGKQDRFRKYARAALKASMEKTK